MKKQLLLSLSVIFLFSFVFSISAHAYTYGDPNKEELQKSIKKCYSN